ncbi:hypothetical protein FF38_12273 [Lucilia cuprina]|uniref:Histone deacetylase complex subunit SAP130 C-terminal domain-containing protein n=1 Tax=Lucilia cuprina TaxID=7375 RepID=A0A0L0CRZ4_LUCCU|nr:hypothetical protein FF38_12273 [Lucilia cuprina]
MSTTDGSNGTGGGGAPGPGGGTGAGPGGGSTATTPTGEPLKIIKTQLIPHPHPASLQHQQSHHSPLPSPTSTPTPTPSSSTTSTTTSNLNNPQIAHVHAPIQLKNPTNVTNLFSLNPVAAKITHVKTTTLDAANNSGLTLSGLSQASGGGGAGATGTIVTSGGLSTVGAIKVGNSGAVATSLSGTPIALNTSQTNTSGATSIRAIGAGGQSTQVRVVMGNIMTPSMIKQLENAGPGRTQITAFPTAPARSVSNTSITVTRTATQATYLPRASVTATQMTGVGLGVPAGQRLVTPIRTTPASVTATGAGATVTGITAAGNFVRGTAVSRNTSSPATTVISPATSTTWMAANTGQVQLIRAIPHQSRQRIITTQGISGSPVSTVASVSGTVVTSTASALQTAGLGNPQQTNNAQQNQQQSTIQAVSSAAPPQQQQQTYVATVLPPRHQLVYSSNVATSQPLNQQQQQQFNQTSVANTGPRFAVATPLTAGTVGSTGAPRQIRPIPFAKSFSAAKLNTTSISIRAPNLTPTIATGVSNANVGGNNASNSPRSTTVTGVTSTANVLPSSNLSATRIIQLQQQPGGTAQQIIGTTGRLAANVMLQPIIVNTSGTNKIGNISIKNSLYSNHHSVVPQQHIMPGTPVTSRNLSTLEHHNLHQQQQSSSHQHSATTQPPNLTIQQRLNGGALDCPPRKKSRRSTNDSQLSTQSQTSLSLPPPQANNNAVTVVTIPPASNLNQEPNNMANGTTAVNANTGGHEVVNGKENTKPVEFILKRPKNCTLLHTYKQSWKSAYNHFQRYSDIKPREERRPTIMDLANQTNVLGKINGWKIYHLKSQMEDLCENESLGYEKLSSMLKQMESNGITTETERISDLLKGNMQRSKIIVDGVSDAQNQIMKIFEHKSHVSDIINRCASKRNYKKREKV